MRILYVLPQIYPYVTGGAEIFHYHLLLQMSQNNEVAYIGYDNINKNAIKFYRLCKLRPWRLTNPIQTIILIYRLRREYDIIHLNYCQGSWLHWFYLPILKKIFRISYGLTIHDPSLYEWKQKKIFKYVFDEAKFIAAVSERLKDGYEKRCNKQIKYLPPLVPLNKLLHFETSIFDELRIPKNSKIVLFAGSLAKYYAIATLYVIPSIHEGKSMSLIEAMFNSLPIIASNAPGINDIIFHKQNGLLFEIDDVSGLADCIRSLIEDRALATILAQNALQDYVRQFRFEDMYNSYIELYENTRSFQ